MENIGIAHQTNVCDEALLQINKKKTNKPIEKWTKVVNKTFSEKKIQMSHRYMTRCKLHSE